jgi:peptide/nickel transport system permease protein
MLIHNKPIRRFLKIRIAVFGAGMICAMLFLSVFGYILAPDSSIHANTIQVSIKLLKPGSRIVFLRLHRASVPKTFSEYFFGEHSDEEWIPITSDYYKKDAAIAYRKYGQPYWNTIDSSSRIKIRTFYLGTDNLGRDVLSRLLVGTRISMLVGLIAVLISLIIGCVFGALSGYYGGWVDRAIMWLIHVFWAIPTVLFAMLLLMGFKGESRFQIFIVFLAVGMTMWVDTARIIRGLFLQLRERQFVEAARSLGFSDARILLQHIFPNTFSTLIVITASNFASAILMEAGLSYLGLGVQPPTPSWGSMLREYYSYIGTDVSYLAIFPGICIMMAVFSFYVFGNGLRDALDVKG